MIIVRIGNEIFRNPQSIRTDRVTLGGCEFAAVRVKDCGGREMCFTVSDAEGATKGATNRDILQLSEAIGQEIGRKCAESPLPHMFINLDKVIADFWGNR